MPSFEKVHTAERIKLVPVQPVFVVVRHTRSGDRVTDILSDDGTNERRHWALETADGVANAAAAAYGHGSSSVFRGMLTVDTTVTLKPE